MRRPPLLALVLALLLVGCARIPTSGPVVAGSPVADAGELHAIVPGPAAQASPYEIVTGFLQAALSAAGDYEVARSYLAQPAAGAWQPGQRTLVYEGNPTITGVDPAGGPTDDPTGDPAPAEDAQVSVSVVAAIDEDGRLVRRDQPTTEQVRLRLTRVDGQWRIASAPDQTLVSSSDLDFVFSPYPLYFVDSAGSFRVPDQRWLADSGSTATRLVMLLLAGPPPWLAPAVQTAFPAGTALRQPAGVQVSGGLATVELTDEARKASEQNRGLMREQLRATLDQLTGVDDVEITVDDALLDVPETSLHAGPTLDDRPAVLRDGTIARLVDGRLVPVDGLPQLGGDPTAELAVDYSSDRFAVLTGSPGSAGSGGAGGAGARTQPEDATETTGALRLLTIGSPLADPVLRGQDLTAPSFDLRGWVFSTQAECTGAVTAVSPDGSRVANVRADWLAGRTVTSLRVSRDGARAVIASTDAAGAHLDLASIARARDGAPVQLLVAPDEPVGVGLVQVREVVWAGESDLAVIGKGPGDDGPRIIRVEVGGPERRPLPALPDVRRVAVGDGFGSMIAQTGSYALMTQAGTRWVPMPDAAGTRAVAYSG